MSAPPDELRETRRVIVGGALAAHPIAGAGTAWAFLQYVLGLRLLGFDTYYVEEIDAGRCVDDHWRPATFSESANARHFLQVMQRFGLVDRSALIDKESDASIGLSVEELEALARRTDLFINLSGRFHRRSVLDAAACRMYVDLDPGFVQIWQQQYGVDMNLAGHDVYVTVGLNLGAKDCPLPTCGIDWHTTLPPVVLDEWRTEVGAGERYTTVGDWRGYSPVEWQGTWYGQKSEEFLKILDLPRRVSVPLELCLAIHPGEPDLPRLIDNGWLLSQPLQHAASLDAYRSYIQGSRGEVTAAKNGYVAGRTGWFSDRSACYLAAGRPVILQDTGFAAHLPTGRGLLSFTDTASAAAAIRSVEADYDAHAAASRAFAAQYLDSRKVLPSLLGLAGVNCRPEG
jgi:hypothetical protein